MIKRNHSSMKIRRKYGRRFLLATTGTVLLGLGLYQAFFASDQAIDEIHVEGTSRKLSGGSCGDFEMATWTVPLLILATLWVFDGLAVVCDEYFQPALEAISDVSKFILS